jgi:hypothetical protein
VLWVANFTANYDVINIITTYQYFQLIDFYLFLSSYKSIEKQFSRNLINLHNTIVILLPCIYFIHLSLHLKCYNLLATTQLLRPCWEFTASCESFHKLESILDSDAIASATGFSHDRNISVYHYELYS